MFCADRIETPADTGCGLWVVDFAVALVGTAITAPYLKSLQDGDVLALLKGPTLNASRSILLADVKATAALALLGR